MVVDHEYERWRTQTGDPVTAPAPAWYTCMYCQESGTHFRGACPRQRPSTAESPEKPAFPGVDWVWDEDEVIALPRQPGLLGRIQAEYQAALDAAERPRADNRAQESRFKSVALEVYKAVPTWGPEVKHLRQACRRVQDLAGELHKAEEALGAVPPRKKGPWVKKREELEARVDALQTELAEAHKASDVSRTIISETFTRIVGQMIS